jgi:hypothetical protein
MGEWVILAADPASLADSFEDAVAIDFGQWES